MVVALEVVYGGTIARALAHAAVVLFSSWLATIVKAATIIGPMLFWK
jgi:hypothetical protein